MASTSRFELTPNRYVGIDEPCFVIAEIGQNHQGKMEIAMQMIKAAAEIKCDCVKLQKCYLESKFTRSALQREYRSPHSFGETYGEHKAALQFTDEQFVTLQRYAHNVGIEFTASAMDIRSVDFLCQINVPFIKIGSGDTDNVQLLKHCANKSQPIVYSTGMHSIDTIKRMYNLIAPLNHRLCILHCVSSYPTPIEDIHLNVIQQYCDEFPSSVIGYSGHELGVHISLAAVVMGAKVLERHFTLDKSMKGSDHKCSLEPQEFKSLVANIRDIEKAMGTKLKQRRDSELDCYFKLGKSIVAATRISKGTVVEEHHLDIKVSVPNGLRPEQMYDIIGRKILNDVDIDCPLQLTDLETAVVANKLCE
ncbi:sialic acid synthase-like protein [Leptotrombidium deliense]|uniref:Sialic acid synthase-like protein n=1 Tax=Leptotrombidium deliense TaxID=299467 RepID=A0A443SB93_9ACAR|nr:sialic acid synthase-like protein [Leptotrombidium deliense]